MQFESAKHRAKATVLTRGLANATLHQCQASGSGINSISRLILWLGRKVRSTKSH